MCYKIAGFGKIATLFIFTLFTINHTNGQESDLINEDYLFDILKGKDSLIDHVIDNSDKYNFQLILSVYDFKSGKEELRTFYINKDSYFFSPASLIKFPLAIVASEKMSWIKKKFGVGFDDSLSLNTCSCDAGTNSYVRKTRPSTFHQFLNELIIMSNNDAYNLLFDLVGTDAMNKRMQELDFDRIVMKNRFYSSCTKEFQKISGGVRFYNEQGGLSYESPCITSENNWEFGNDWPRNAGNSHIENGKRVSGPKSFSNVNYVSLSQAHQLMITLIEENKKGAFEKLHLDRETGSTLVDALGSFPRELKSMNHETKDIPDYYYKFFIDPKSMDTKNGQLRVYNKVGISGGFISDVSYFEDKNSGLRFYISASMMPKKDGAMDNGRYDYYSIGIPTFRKIGSILYRYLSGYDIESRF